MSGSIRVTMDLEPDPTDAFGHTPKAAKTPRVPFDRKGFYVWRAEDAQQREKVLEHAVFVVHGIGAQAYVETSVVLRNGVESVLSRVLKNPRKNRVPAPYTTPGYWADYSDFSEAFPDHWRTMGKGEQDFFQELWKKRSSSRWRTFWWLVLQDFKMVFRPDGFRSAQGGFRGFLGDLFRWLRHIFLVFPLSTLLLAYVCIRHPLIMSEVLSDIRVYVDPQGEVENAIAQQIDRRVGESFLALLGMDSDFRDLPPSRLPQIADKPHKFERVTWVAHSLGTVISYNVIADLLVKAQAIRAKETAGPVTPELEEQRRNVERFEHGFHRFFTMGSPLAKIAAFFPHVLRPWPEGSAERFAQHLARRDPEETPDRAWWVNFFHTWDPVSGHIQARDPRPFQSPFRKTPKAPNPTYFPSEGKGGNVLLNRQGRQLVVPWSAHTSYWTDRRVLWHVFMETYDARIENLLTWKDLTRWQKRWRRLFPEGRLWHWRVFNLTAAGFLVYGIAWSILRYGLWPLVEKVLRFLVSWGLGFL